MELRVLKYYLAVVREGNISKAAKALHMTQPSLSRQMHDLEEELGVELFERGRRITLTEEGIVLKRRAEEVVQLVGRIPEEVTDATEVSGTVAIGTGQFLASRGLSRLVARFREEYPHVRFHMRLTTADGARDQLDEGLLDVALMARPRDLEGLDYLRIRRRERWGLLVSATHPLASKPVVTYNDVRTEALAMTESESLRQELRAWSGGHLDDASIIATYNVSPAAISLVDEGAASLLCVEGTAFACDPAQTVFIPLAPEVTTPVVVAWKVASAMGRAQRLFIQYLRDNAGELEL